MSFRDAALPRLLVAVLLLLAVPAFAHDELAPRRVLLEAEQLEHPDDAILALHRAELARLAGDFDAAERALAHAALQRAPAGNLAACRAALALDRRRYAEVRAIAAEALAATPRVEDRDAATVAILDARAAHALGDGVAAIAAFDRGLALAASPRADLFLERAAFAREVGDPAEELAGLEDASRRLPHDGAIVDALAIAYAAAGRADEAARVLADWPDAEFAVLEERAAAAAAAPAPPRLDAVTRVARGEPGSWATPGSEPAGWDTPGYVDAAWSAGPAPLGFGDPFIATSIPMGPTSSVRYTTSYFRRAFPAGSPGTIVALTLTANYDDGFVAYLNGTEIARRGLGTGSVVYGTFAANHEGGTYETIDVTSALPLLVAGTNVLAVEVHQATNTSSDLAWDCDLVGSTGGPEVTRGPYLQNGTPDAITIRWRTNAPTDSRVWLGEAPGALAPVVTDPALVTEHEVRLTGLGAEQAYAYAIGSTAGVLAGDDAAHVFRTAPAAGAPRPLRAWVLGDSGIPGAPQNRVRDAYAAFTAGTPTDVWLMLGDNAYASGTDAEYQAGLFAPYAAMLRTNVLWPTRGNHDLVHAGGGNDYYDLFTMPTGGEAGGVPSSSEAWYAFDHGDVHFVCLDSEGSSRAAGSPMLTWLAADLAANERAWTIVFFHHPPYTKGSHDSDDAGDSGGRMRDMRANVLPLLEAAGVDLVLAGHSHSYERSYLIDGHHDVSSTLAPGMLLDTGDGDPRPGGDGAYVKTSQGSAPHEGEVVAVAGSSAQISGGSLTHPAMVRSLNVLGSLVLDVTPATAEAPGRLDGTFLDDLGAVRDRFAIVKGAATVSVPQAGGSALALRVVGANPFRGGVRLAFHLPRSGEASIRILDASGRRVRTLVSGGLDGGAREASWDGHDESGRRAPAGLYFAVLESGRERRVVRLLRLDSSG